MRKVVAGLVGLILTSLILTGAGPAAANQGDIVGVNAEWSCAGLEVSSQWGVLRVNVRTDGRWQTVWQESGRPNEVLVDLSAVDRPITRAQVRVRMGGSSVNHLFDISEPTCGPDGDGDGRPDTVDNCPGTPNADQGDLDGDGLGDACDDDIDGDNLNNEGDNCPNDANPGQEDADDDGVGDSCDPTPYNEGTFVTWECGEGIRVVSGEPVLRVKLKIDRRFRTVYRNVAGAPLVELDVEDMAPVEAVRVQVRRVVGNTVRRVWMTFDVEPPTCLETASIGDRVWSDLDRDGIQDPDEPGVAAVILHLHDSSGAFLQSATTDTNGEYQFTDLEPGDYEVRVGGGFPTSATVANVGDDALDSDFLIVQGSEGEEVYQASVALGAGQQDTSIDLGLVFLVEVGGSVWNDGDEDGVRGPGEANLAGVTVELVDDSTGTVVAAAITDEFESYQLQAPTGTYRLRVTPPSGSTFSPRDQGEDDELDSDVDPVTGESELLALTAAGDAAQIDAGLIVAPQNGELGDFVWLDENRNGRQDNNEPGLPGVTVELRTDATTVVASTSTDGDGLYRFIDVAPGTYRIYVLVDQATTGLVPTFLDESGSIGPSLDNNINSSGYMSNVIVGLLGTVDLDWDAGYHLDLRISGRVWEDRTGDGVRGSASDEPSLVGVTVRLLDSEEEIVETATTTSSGFYSFQPSAPGTYRIAVILPSAEATFSPQDQGPSEFTDSDVDSGGRSGQIVLTAPDATSATVDAGIVLTPPLPSNIGNFVWFDDNRDGIQDPGEAGIGDVTVELTSSSGGPVIESTVTDPDGFYEFVDVAPGGYRVAFSGTPLIGLGPTVRDQGDDDLDSDLGLAWISVTVTGDGVDDQSQDAGFVTNLRITGTVWDDVDLDGSRDGGESRISGVPVELLDSDEVVVATEITGALGTYRFDGLAPGTYQVRFTAPADTTFTVKDTGSDSVDSDVDPGTGITDAIILSIPGNITESSVDAGLIPTVLPDPANVGGFVWLDADQDGIQDSGEQGLAQVRVELRDGATILETVITGGSGLYSFNEVNPGSYNIRTVSQIGYGTTLDNVGEDDTVDSDIGGTGQETGIEQFTILGADVDIDAGYRHAGRVQGQVWNDENGDGLRQGAEQRLADVAVHLLDESGTSVATLTSSNGGSYGFDFLAPGTYAVRFTAPSGMAFTIRDAGAEPIDSDVDPVDGTSDQFVLTIPGPESSATIDAGFVLDGDGDGVAELFDNCPAIANPDQTDTDDDGIGDVCDDDDDNDGLTDVDEATLGTDPLKPDTDDDGALDPADNCPLISNGSQTDTDDDGLGDACDDDDDNDGLTDDQEAGLDTDPLDPDSDDDGLTDGAEVNVHGTDPLDGDSDDGGSDDGTEVNIDGTDPLDPSDDLADSDDDGVADPVDNCPGTANPGQIDTDDDGDGDACDDDDDGDGVDDPVDNCPLISNGSQTDTDDDGLGDACDDDDDNDGLTDDQEAGLDTDPLDPDSDGGGVDDGTEVNVDGTDPLDPNDDLVGATIGDFAWLDVNGDGIQDAGEPGLEGIALELLDQTTFSVVATATTDADGAYVFRNLDAGDYLVGLDSSLGGEGPVLPPGLDLAPVDVGENDDVDSDPVAFGAEVSVGSGEVNSSIDVGFVYALGIAGRVWNDQQGDGVRSTDPGVPGATVELVNDQGTVVDTTVTAGSVGFYSFNGLAPGTYRVRFASVPDTTFTIKDAGSSDFLDSDADPTTGETDDIVLSLTGTQFASGVDAGVIFPPGDPSTIGDFVWFDEDRNGRQGATEVGLAGVTVDLRMGSTVVASVVTGADGAYEFADVESGVYTLRFDPPNGYAPTDRDQGSDDAIDSDVLGSSTGFISNLALDGTNDPTIDAGFVLNLGITGRVWDDVNGDGIQAPGSATEPAVSGVTVELLDDGGQLLASKTTGPTGSYSFFGLSGGSYQVRFNAPAGQAFTLQDQGTSDARDSDVDSSGVTPLLVLSLGGSTTLISVDAGLVTPP